MTTDIVPAGPQGLAVPQGTGGQYDQSDYSLPYVTLVQASSEVVKDGNAKPGVFISTDGEQYTSIECVPLHIQYTRDFFDKNRQQAICGSHDRIIGYPKDLNYFRINANLNVEDGVPLNCADCPFSEWSPDAKMACLKGYTVTLYDLTTETPFLMRVRGTAVTVFRNSFIGAVSMGRTVPWARAYEMTSTKKSNGGNSWFVPVLKPVKGHSDEEKEAWANYARQFGAHAQEESSTIDPDDLPFE